jgi:hypothetical protein
MASFLHETKQSILNLFNIGPMMPHHLLLKSSVALKD